MRLKKISKALILFIILVLLTELFFLFGLQNRKNYADLNTDRVNILCLGDSFTYGVGAGVDHSWPIQMETILNTGKSNQKFRIYNLARFDFNTSMIVKKLNDFLLVSKPDIVIVMAGGTDEGGWGNAGEQLRLFIATRRMKVDDVLKDFFTIIMGLGANDDRVNHGKYLTEKKSAQTIALRISELLKTANDYREERYFEKARIVYEEALMLDGDNIQVLFELSRNYKLEESYYMAINTILKIIQINPYYLSAFGELKDVLLLSSDPEKAVDVYTQLNIIFPGNHLIEQSLFDALLVLGDDFFRREKIANGLICYKQALLLKPYNQNVLQRELYNKAIEQISKTESNNFLHKIKLYFQSFFDRRRRSFTHVNRRDENMKKNLREIIRICNSKDVLLIFSSYPSRLFTPMQELSQAYNIDLVDNRQVFQELLSREQQGSLYFNKDGHCTKAGYAIVAENIAKAIFNIMEKN